MRKEPIVGVQAPLLKGRSATNRTPRELNRKLVFDLVRTSRSISRADIARHSGLQRSTVSLIIEDLVKEGWLFEGASAKLPRGRRPVLIQLSESHCVIALDIHPSRITLAITDLSGDVVSQRSIIPPKEPSRTIGVICSAIKDLMAEHSANSFVGIGICLPGRIDPNSEKSIFAPRLDWRVARLKAEVQRATSLPVGMDNVANACALAQVWFGESKAGDGLAIVNVSEGISVGLFVNGKILRGRGGMAGEFGHVQISPEKGLLCACGNYGCWETLASNTAALRYHRELTGRRSAPTFEALIKAALDGEAAAIEAITRAAIQLGRGIRVLLSGIAPAEIVIVGELAAVWTLAKHVIESEMHHNALVKLPSLRCTDDGDGSRLRAAAALILSELSV